MGFQSVKVEPPTCRLQSRHAQAQYSIDRQFCLTDRTPGYPSSEGVSGATAAVGTGHSSVVRMRKTLYGVHCDIV